MKTIGVLGGMGPESTAEFYRLLIKECQNQYGARLDSDYPEIIILNLPIPEPVLGIEEQKTVEMLGYGLRKLEKAGAELVAVPCNTIQSLFPKMRKMTKAKLLNIAELTMEKAKTMKLKRFGLLATPTTIKNKVYRANQLEIVFPQNQEIVTKAILDTLAGKKADKNALIAEIEKMANSGAEAIIIGCTDLSLAISQSDTKIQLIDSLSILSEATIRMAQDLNTVFRFKE